MWESVRADTVTVARDSGIFSGQPISQSAWIAYELVTAGRLKRLQTRTVPGDSY